MPTPYSLDHSNIATGNQMVEVLQFLFQNCLAVVFIFPSFIDVINL